VTSRLERYSKTAAYSWAVKVDFEINERGGFKDLDGDSISLLCDQPYALTLKPRKNTSDARSRRHSRVSHGH